MKTGIYLYICKVLFLANAYYSGVAIASHNLDGWSWLNFLATILLFIGLTLNRAWTKWGLKE